MGEGTVKRSQLKVKSLGKPFGLLTKSNARRKILTEGQVLIIFNFAL